MLCSLHIYDNSFISAWVKNNKDGIKIKAFMHPSALIEYKRIKTIKKYNIDRIRWTYGCVGILYENGRGEENFIHITSINTKKFLTEISTHNVPIAIEEMPSLDEFPKNLYKIGMDL